jgi:hypothetical protein
MEVTVVTDTTLLAGPYTPPPLERGDRAMCLYRCVTKRG